jgi:hypothetical protein
MRASSWKQIFDRRSLRQIEQTRLQARSATGAASAIRSTRLQAGETSASDKAPALMMSF